MAWIKMTNCQQCSKKLSKKDLAESNRVCRTCVKKNNGKIWGRDEDDDYEDGE